MKHLKRFEKSVNIKFKIGDYVTIISDVFNCRVGQTGFVEKCDDDGGCHILLLNSTVTYYWNGELRLATAQEIEDYKIKRSINKYNL